VPAHQDQRTQLRVPEPLRGPQVDAPAPGALALERPSPLPVALERLVGGPEVLPFAALAAGDDAALANGGAGGRGGGHHPTLMVAGTGPLLPPAKGAVLGGERRSFGRKVSPEPPECQAEVVEGRVIANATTD